MLEINLLPWREQKRLRAQRIFWNVWIASSFGIAVIVLSLNWILLTQIDKQITKNNAIAKQLKSLHRC